MEETKQAPLPGNEEFESDDENIPFYVNKNGFPVDGKTWERMWKYAGKIYPEARKEMQMIKDGENVVCDVSIPTAPVYIPQMGALHFVKLVQNYINSLNYNHTGTQLFEIRKSRPLAGLMDTAKEMVKESLPIKCLEAVILAIYLTNCLPSLERFPIGFKSMFKGHRYYHVVLGVMYNGRYGALGLSRRTDLMDKPVLFKNLSDLIEDYDIAYSKYTHSLKKVRVGSVVPHDSCSQERIHWGVLSVSYSRSSQIENQRRLDRYSKEMRSRATYIGPPASPKKERPRNILLPRREHTMAPMRRPNSDLRTTKSANLQTRQTSSVKRGFHVKV